MDDKVDHLSKQKDPNFNHEGFFGKSFHVKSTEGLTGLYIFLNCYT